MALICLSIAVDSLDEAVETANRKDLACDIVEVRLDFLKDTSDIKKLSGIEKPLMITCMPEYEGGKYTGSEKDRIMLLESCLEFSKYVSIELKAEPVVRDGFIKRAKEAGVRVIIAHHDFEKTPSIQDIKDILKLEAEAGADIVKISYMAVDASDVLHMMQAISEIDIMPDIIALSMGEKGSLSRVIAPSLGAYLTFGCAEKGKEVAPGQLTVNELRQIGDLLW